MASQEHPDLRTPSASRGNSASQEGGIVFQIFVLSFSSAPLPLHHVSPPEHSFFQTLLQGLCSLCSNHQVMHEGRGLWLVGEGKQEDGAGMT